VSGVAGEHASERTVVDLGLSAAALLCRDFLVVTVVEGDVGVVPSSGGATVRDMGIAGCGALPSNV